MIREAVLRSIGVVRVHPWVMLALGSALVLAIASTFTGLGFVLAPWFACEVIALSLGASGIAMQPRGVAWIEAALFVLTVGVLFGSVVALAGLVFGPDLATVDRSTVMPWDQSLLRIFGIFGISIVALAYVLPFVHVPGILIERGGTFGTAVLESMLLVRRVGVLPTFRLVLVAAVFALFPAVVAAMIAGRTLDRASTPLGLLASAPFLLLSLPVGLGVVAQGYLLVRHRLPARHLVHRSQLGWTTLVLLACGVLAPVVGLVLLLVACALPAPLLRGPIPSHATRVLDTGSGERVVPGSTLSILLASDHAEVRTAFDDAIATLSTPRSRSGRRPFARAVVYSLGDLFAVELRGVDGASEGHALFTAAGARVDDTVHRALDERMGVERALVFGPTFLVVALLVLAALGPLAETRNGERPSPERLAQAHARALRVGVLLVPFWGLIVTLGALAVAGW
ncbi:MAG: hypothetical protein J0L92_20605 [Deltaproteobacteria bacterium]|nr:hypothetical protein [Deltaproteobacteria bacterium]